MRIVRNIGHVKRRKRLAKWGAFLGFLLLMGAIALPYLYPRFFAYAYLALLAGFLVFNVGMQQLGKWTNAPRNPRNDLLLDGLLAEFGDRYALVHYPALGKRVVEHLLVHPGGVLVLTARELSGSILARGTRWRKRGFGLRRLFGLSGPQLGNPVYETQQGIVAAEAHLAAAQIEVDVQGAVVFLGPLVELEVDQPAVPALRGTELADFVRALPADASLRPAERQALVEALSKGDELEFLGQQRTRRRPVKRRAA